MHRAKNYTSAGRRVTASGTHAGLRQDGELARRVPAIVERTALRWHAHAVSMDHTESVCRQVYKVAVEYAKLRLTERGFGRAVRAAFLEDAARLRRLIAEDLRLDRKKAYRKNGHAE